MDLVLWRHAQAQEIEASEDPIENIRRDMARSLTGRGQKEAARMARWLDHQLIHKRLRQAKSMIAFVR